MISDYKENGYFIVKGLFKKNELVVLHSVLQEFHKSWKKKNFEHYSKKAINSAYITGTTYLDDSNRQKLFKFIGSTNVMNILATVIPEGPAFMGTQLFFNPVNENQKNYWHRDPQYHLSIEEQKEALNGSTVLHFRIPLVDESGIELVPGTHNRWDSEEELEVRLENNNRINSENISTGIRIKLEAGDLLVFSANMIHRGIYGMDRFAFDILFCDPAPELVNFLPDECIPNQEILKNVEDPSAFFNTIRLKANNKAMQATSA